MKKFILAIGLLSSQLLFAEATIKYQGVLEMPATGPHKDGAHGQLQVLFDGDKLSKITLKTEKSVFGQSDYVSSEQRVFSRVREKEADMVFVFKFVGPSHKWNYMIFVTTKDEGQTYSGTLYKVRSSVEDIKKVIEGNANLPAEWKSVGQVTLDLVK